MNTNEKAAPGGPARSGGVFRVAAVGLLAFWAGVLADRFLFKEKRPAPVRIIEIEAAPPLPGGPRK
jgi:hypothetical protein